MKFTKMHGLGNDFILVDGFKEELPEDLAQTAILLCDRHFGIGADGLVLALPSLKKAVKMRIFNPDGSEAEMCGNAIRCFSKYVYEKGYVEEQEFTVETKAGIMVPRLIIENQKVSAVQVDMGEPYLDRSSVPMLGPHGQAINEPLTVLDRTFKVTTLLMGVPHCVIIVDNVAEVDLQKYGPALENHPIFPRKTNVDFIEILNENEIKMRVWERAAGLTLACGTGACASFVAASIKNRVKRKGQVRLPGGTLEIEWAANNHVYMTGPAEQVFCGEIKDF